MQWRTASLEERLTSFEIWSHPCSHLEGRRTRNRQHVGQWSVQPHVQRNLVTGTHLFCSDGTVSADRSFLITPHMSSLAANTARGRPFMIPSDPTVRVESVRARDRSLLASDTWCTIVTFDFARLASYAWLFLAKCTWTVGPKKLTLLQH